MKLILIPLLFLLNNAAAQSPGADSSISIFRLQQTVAHLTNDSLEGRLTGSKGAALAALFIADKFYKAGLQFMPGRHSYFDSFFISYSSKKIEGVNIIAALPGAIGNDSVVIFSAHYDHVGKGSDLAYNKGYSKEDEIFNGANDNATGVAALLEIANYFALQKNNRHTILFIAFAGEEMGMLGSKAFVQKIKTKLVKAVINLEMLGKPVDNSCFIVTPGNANVRKTLNNQLEQNELYKQEKFFLSDPFHEAQLAYRSDHYSFAGKVKNAFTIMASSPYDEYYHTVDDEIETINFSFLLTATLNIAIACTYFIK